MCRWGGAAQVAQPCGFAQLAQIRRGFGAGFFGATQQNALHFGGVGDQFGIACAHRGNLAVDAFKQRLFGIAPGNAVGKGAGKGGGFFGAGKGTVDLEQGAVVGAFGFARRARIGDDGHDFFAQLIRWRKQRNGVVVAFAHLASVQPGQQRHVVVHLRFGRHQQVFAVQVVEAGGHVACHFDVLHLVAPHGYALRLKHENVGRHQHRVHEQAGSYAVVGLLPGFGIFVLRGLVGVGAVEQALAADAGQQPHQLGDFGDVTLAIKGHALGIQPHSQPGSGNFERAALDACGVVTFDQRVVVCQKVVAAHIGAQAGLHRRAHGAYVIAQVGRAGGGDAGEVAGDGRCHGEQSAKAQLCAWVTCRASR